MELLDGPGENLGMGAFVLIFTGVFLALLSMPIGPFLKFAYLLYDLGIMGVSFWLFSWAFREEGSSRASLLIAGAILLLALKL